MEKKEKELNALIQKNCEEVTKAINFVDEKIDYISKYLM